MMRFAPMIAAITCFFVATSSSQCDAADDAKTYRSHPPQRLLPGVSNRPLTNGPAYFVDAKRGDDRNEGGKSSPWKTVKHAVKRLKPGETLVLRGGMYYEHVKITRSGAPGKPVTIRSHPGELAVIDGGFREFHDAPATAWEPLGDGEFRSTKRYPGIERAAGNFADSMVPLHGYRRRVDLTSNKRYARPTKDRKNRPPQYFGPGLWHDGRTGRIHCRLTHTQLPYFGTGNNYRGETDPRKLRLVVAGYNQQPLHMQGVSHIRLQDFVLRGGGANTLLIRQCRHVELEGLTLFVADRGLRVETTGHLRVHRTAFRGPSPPWGSRSASKYRAFDSHLLVPVGTYETRRDKRKYLSPQCHDFEISHCEFTDGHDGPYIGGVHRLTFHHNLVDNMNDDGVYLSAWGPPGSDVRVFQNRISKCLTAFAFGLGRGSESDPGTGTSIYRNLIDLRAPVPYSLPGKNNRQVITSYGRLCGDHGGPVWEPIRFYHNTVIAHSSNPRMFGFGLAGHMRKTKRRVFNNLFVQVLGLPDLRFPSAKDDYQSDGNLCWGYADGPKAGSDLLSAYRKTRAFAESRRRYAPGWEAAGLFANPRFARFSQNPSQPIDIRLRANSPAINAGVALPKTWPDPLRRRDNHRPDIGALPAGAAAMTVGVRQDM